MGGTALPLQLGHRKSIDLDFFNTENFDISKMQDALIKKFKSRIKINSTLKNKIGIFAFIDDIKVDIVKHPFKLICPILIIENIRMWDLIDIAASKNICNIK